MHFVKTQSSVVMPKNTKRRHVQSEILLAGMVFVYLLVCIRMWLQLANEDSSIVPSFDTRTNQQGKLFLPTTTVDEESGNHLLYIGKFGLGHRFSKLVAAYHLAHELCPYLTEFRVDWGTCGEGSHNNTQPDIFAYLFGSNRLQIPCPRRRVPTSTSGKALIVRNDVQGYYAGQSYKNSAIPLQKDQLLSLHSPWNHKMELDRLFFAQLLEAFQRHHGEALRRFRREVDWDAHYVVGLHLRAGNGEKDHFIQANRGLQNITEWALSVARTLQCGFGERNRLLVFVATDTPELIPLIKTAFTTDIPMVVFPQERLASNQGVSYQQWTAGRQCYGGWQSAMSDMALLAASDSVVAATRSTFTQILPLSQILPSGISTDTTDMKYCEMGDGGQTMTCFHNRQQWLLRNEGEVTWRSTNEMRNQNQCQEDSSSAVVHKLMVHLPDIDEGPLRLQAIDFLRNSNDVKFYYGRVFAQKYRHGAKEVFRKDWTWMP